MHMFPIGTDVDDDAAAVTRWPNVLLRLHHHPRRFDVGRRNSSKMGVSALDGKTLLPGKYEMGRTGENPSVAFRESVPTVELQWLEHLWDHVRNRGCSRQRGLIIAPGQEA